ncbi:hypothetical protein BY996DRAFT_6534429 [Phakopsora pachyrhizi]|nr:hypothetical protein BY996DRAFT_6534429 [Phakopsora pachyrhizi]
MQAGDVKEDKSWEKARSLIDDKGFERIKGNIESDNWRKEAESLKGSGIGKRDNQMELSGGWSSLENHFEEESSDEDLRRRLLEFKKEFERLNKENRIIQKKNEQRFKGISEGEGTGLRLNLKRILGRGEPEYCKINPEVSLKLPIRSEEGEESDKRTEAQRIEDREDIGLQEKEAENGVRNKKNNKRGRIGVKKSPIKARSFI